MTTNRYGTYDEDLRMYVEPVRIPNVAKLEYWRHVANTPALADDRDPGSRRRHTAWCRGPVCAAGCMALRPADTEQHTDLQVHLYGQ